MAGVDALIAPRAFKAKDKEAEVLLIDFDLYVKTIRNFFIATGKDTVTDRQKVALLQAVGGPDMVDLVEEVGKVILVAIAADTVNKVEAVDADTFEQAIEKIRQGIVGKTNQAMSRLKLFQQMGQGRRSLPHGTRKCSSRPSDVTGPCTTPSRLPGTASCTRHLTRN